MLEKLLRWNAVFIALGWGFHWETHDNSCRIKLTIVYNGRKCSLVRTMSTLAASLTEKHLGIDATDQFITSMVSDMLLSLRDHDFNLNQPVKTVATVVSVKVISEDKPTKEETTTDVS